ncbi:UDP-N-acetylglucosamine 2-epimerase, partial [Aeromonas veronii]
ATLAGSLVAYFNQIKLAHIEASLRTYNKFSPFPEEMNRQIVGLMADYHFTPTEMTKENLLKEGKPKNQIFVVGNSAIDMF